MSGPEFWQTGMGKRFYERDVPALARALERIADRLEDPPEPERPEDIKPPKPKATLTATAEVTTAAERATEETLRLAKLKKAGEALQMAEELQDYLFRTKRAPNQTDRGVLDNVLEILERRGFGE